MKTKHTDESWNELAEKNAQHSAHLHIESGNAAKIAEAFKDVHPQKALEFLFNLAEEARKERKLKRASVILEAVALIDRTTGVETDVIVESHEENHKEKTTVFVQRFTPAEIFASPVVYHDLEEIPDAPPHQNL